MGKAGNVSRQVKRGFSFIVTDSGKWKNISDGSLGKRGEDH